MLQKIVTAPNGARAFFLMAGSFYGTWISRIPAFEDRFEVPHDVLGTLFLLMAIGAFVSFPIAGWLSDKYGPRRMTRLGSLAAAPFLVSIAFAPTVWTFGLALFLYGFGSGIMVISMNGWGTAVAKASPRPIMSGIHAMFSIGAAGATAIGAVAAHYGLSPALHYLAFVLVIMPLAHAVATAPWTDRVKAVDTPKVPLRLPKKALVLVAAITACSAIGEGAMADWGALLAIETVGVGEGAAAFGYSLFAAAMVVGRLGGDPFVHRVGEVMTTRISGLLAAIGVLIAVTSGHIYVTYLAYGIMGLGYANLVPLAISRAADEDPENPGASIATVSSMGHGGMLLGPVLIGFVSEATSLRTGFGLLGVIALGAILIAGVMRRPQAHPQAA
ncbi:MFS transporter [Parvularcula sp. LCG005]|uniref:MFS transporter n=1 Tax=Parvularcula sp. LCG005 TaxID=3078805 RepID=UPI002943C257|nr:MFS transporter [Parvularcula sp. LCG005]WOI53542.1 MFS transporter [Parvularcula sp. LCG005]